MKPGEKDMTYTDKELYCEGKAPMSQLGVQSHLCGIAMRKDGLIVTVTMEEYAWEPRREWICRFNYCPLCGRKLKKE